MSGVEVKGIKEVTVKLKKMSEGVGPSAGKSLRTYAFSLIGLAQTLSPVDSGRFKGAWQIKTLSIPGTIAAVEVSNPMVYGPVLEYGSKAGSLPWKKPGPKTVAQGGRIWSRLAKGGILTPILPKVSSDAAEAVFKGLKE